MMPDLTTAANKAQEIREKFAGMEPLCILKSMNNVLVYSFAQVSAKTGETRDRIIASFIEPCDAVSLYSNGKYIVVYNQLMPFVTVRNALAREIGHIVLGHDGSRPEDVRNEEANHFAKCLLEE